MKKIVLASGNQGKLKEFQALMGKQFKLIPQSELGVSEVAETGSTYVENAIIKARHAAKITGLPAIADDSGIEVRALQGRPGLYSARYAGPGATAVDRNAKLLEEMKGVPDGERQARFVCVLVFMQNSDDATPVIAEGFCEGVIVREPKGGRGFGYNPILYRLEEQCTVSELSEEAWFQVSHRGNAVRVLLPRLELA